MFLCKPHTFIASHILSSSLCMLNYYFCSTVNAEVILWSYGLVFNSGVNSLVLYYYNAQAFGLLIR